MSGGRTDASALAVASLEHEGEVAVLQCLRVAPSPHDPEAVVADFVRTLHAYRIYRVTGDRYAGAWVATAFERHGIRYEPAPRSASDSYLELLPAVNAARVELLDSPMLRLQLTSLERKVRGGSRDQITHPRGSHDDLANAVALALVELLGERPVGDLGCSFGAVDPALLGEGHVREDREVERARDLRLIAEAERRRCVDRRAMAGPLERGLWGVDDDLDRVSVYDAPDDAAQEG